MLFNREPVLVSSLVRAALVLATAFGLQWDATRTGAVILFVEAVLAVIVRGTVTSPATAAQQFPTPSPQPQTAG